MYKAIKVAASVAGISAVIGIAGLSDKRPSFFDSIKPDFSVLYRHQRDNFESLLSYYSYVAQAKSASVENLNVIENNTNKLKKRNDIMKYGYPTFDNLRQYEDHILAYSNIHKAPLWVCEHLTEDSITCRDNVSRKQSKFTADNSVDPIFKCGNSDYLNSGYDRGHLAAAANHQESQKAMDDTFYLTNICPQTGKGLNRSKWNDLEKRGRTLARKHGSVHVITGPLFLPTIIGKEKFVKYRLIGDNNVAVPTHFFKTILATNINKGGYHLESYVMPNEEIRDDLPISSFLVPKIAIEKGAGFRVFDFVADSQFKTINGHPNPDYIA